MTVEYENNRVHGHDHPEAHAHAALSAVARHYSESHSGWARAIGVCPSGGALAAEAAALGSEVLGRAGLGARETAQQWLEAF